MTSRTSTHPSFLSPHGSDPELSIPCALGEDEKTVLTVRRTSDVYALQIVDDAAPEAIDDEPTVPILFRRTGGLRAVHPRSVR